MTKITTVKPDGVARIMDGMPSGIHPAVDMKILKKRNYGKYDEFFSNSPWCRLADENSGHKDWVTLDVSYKVVEWFESQDRELYALTEEDTVIPWRRKVYMDKSLFTLLLLKF